MHALPGISYLRTTRGETAVLYGPDETFVPGGSRIVRDHEGPDVTIVAAGITVHESLAAAERLAVDGVEARVIDVLGEADRRGDPRDAAAASGLIVTVEDHRPEGGLGDAVLDALAAGPARPPVVKLAVRELPGSGTPEELLAGAGIDAAAIERAVREGLSRRGAGPRSSRSCPASRTDRPGGGWDARCHPPSPLYRL
jgi:transketolase